MPLVGFAGDAVTTERKVTLPARQFSWPDECRQAFEELKKYLTSPPLLVRPKVGEVLYLYLATSPEAVSSVLVWKNENRVHQPIYYVSKVLHEAETRYSKAEKMIFALVISAQRLHPYFQAHAIVVLTDQPLRAILHRPDTSGRLAKWAVRLGEFDIQYRPRPALKAQVLTDFIVECPTIDLPSGEGDPVEVGTSDCDPDPTWVLHIDGASNAQGSGADFLLTNSKGVVTEHALRFDFKASNNQAEYEVLIAGLKLALELGIDRLKVFFDSQLIVGQTKGEFETRDPTMAKYHRKVKDLVAPFGYFGISYIPRTKNARADALSRLAMSDYGALGWTFVQNLERPSIDEVEEVLQLAAEQSWMDPITQYLIDGSVSEDPTEAKRLQWAAFQYVMINGRLYKRSFSLPLLRWPGDIRLAADCHTAPYNRSTEVWVRETRPTITFPTRRVDCVRQYSRRSLTDHIGRYSGHQDAPKSRSTFFPTSDLRLRQCSRLSALVP
ncbi:uncharacterized protein [Elaeis guineensis]|uniref:uncharacterized protein n=1 Tax=Elaeis guineensis var. tenera TaxID=51953 RepID=UPI003C6D4313